MEKLWHFSWSVGTRLEAKKRAEKRPPKSHFTPDPVLQWAIFKSTILEIFFEWPLFPSFILSFWYIHSLFLSICIYNTYITQLPLGLGRNEKVDLLHNSVLTNSLASTEIHTKYRYLLLSGKAFRSSSVQSRRSQRCLSIILKNEQVNT